MLCLKNKGYIYAFTLFTVLLLGIFSISCNPLNLFREEQLIHTGYSYYIFEIEENLENIEFSNISKEQKEEIQFTNNSEAWQEEFFYSLLSNFVNKELNINITDFGFNKLRLKSNFNSISEGFNFYNVEIFRYEETEGKKIRVVKDISIDLNKKLVFLQERSYHNAFLEWNNFNRGSIGISPSEATHTAIINLNSNQFSSIIISYSVYNKSNNTWKVKIYKDNDNFSLIEVDASTGEIISSE